MNNMNPAQNASNPSYKKQDLLECYPDIDYEMIPYKEPQSFTGQPANFYVDQLSPNELKNLFKDAQKFEITSRSRSASAGSPVLHFSGIKEKILNINTTPGLTISIPIKDISKFRQSKKYTKIRLKNNITIRTNLNFKKLIKSFLKNDLILKEKWNQKLNNKEIHLPKA